MSVSPSTVVSMPLLALGASITTRIQMSLPLAAEIRADVVITPWPGPPLGTTVLISVLDAAALRVGRTLRGIGADAATMLARSTGDPAGT